MGRLQVVVHRDNPLLSLRSFYYALRFSSRSGVRARFRGKRELEAGGQNETQC